jgi:DNA invertase Pin-like site-specific DNA recombinase
MDEGGIKMNALVIIKTGGSDDYDNQLMKCTAYAEGREWNITNIYSNEQGCIITEIAEYLHDVDLVLTTELTRITSGLGEAHGFLSILQKHRIKLYTVKDGEIADFNKSSL